MQLVGMLDSPYVRRVAIALRLLGLPFEHRPISVFRHLDEFQRVNPVVKVPTLVCDDGSVLMESGLILDYLEALAGRSLWPAPLPERVRALRVAGLALAACEKSVQIVYERELRPADKVHAPWFERVQRQQRAALQALDAAVAGAPALAQPDHGAIAAAVAWRFTQLRPETAEGAQGCDALAAFARELERLPAFAETPPDERADVSTPR